MVRASMLPASGSGQGRCASAATFPIRPGVDCAYPYSSPFLVARCRRSRCACCICLRDEAQYIRSGWGGGHVCASRRASRSCACRRSSRIRTVDARQREHGVSRAAVRGGTSLLRTGSGARAEPWCTVVRHLHGGRCNAEQSLGGQCDGRGQEANRRHSRTRTPRHGSPKSAQRASEIVTRYWSARAR